MVDCDGEDTARCVIHEGLRQCRPVLGVNEARIHRRVQDGVVANRGNRGRFIDQRNSNCVCADRAGRDIVVGARAQGVVETRSPDRQWAHRPDSSRSRSGRLRPHRWRQGCDDLGALAFELFLRIRATAILIFIGTTDGGTIINGCEVVQHIEGRDLASCRPHRRVAAGRGLVEV